MRKDTTPLGRLAELLTWMNDETNPYTADGPDVLRYARGFAGAVGRFLVAFDGTPAAGHVEVLRWPKGTPHHVRRWGKTTSAWRFGLDPDKAQDLHVSLAILLTVGFEGPDAFGPGGGTTMPMPTLRFGVRNARRPNVKISTLTASERRAYAAPGAFVLQVGGSVEDLTKYLLLHLLTREGLAGVLGRCPAPAPHKWESPCNKWVLRTGHGRKRDYCSTACRVRQHAKRNKDERERDSREAVKARKSKPTSKTIKQR